MNVLIECMIFINCCGDPSQLSQFFQQKTDTYTSPFLCNINLIITFFITFQMFCLQEKELHADPFNEKDPLESHTLTDSSDDEPSSKRLKFDSELNLKVYQIPTFNTPKSLSIYPIPSNTLSNTLPKFVNNPLNLANPLDLAANVNNVVKSLQSRYSLPAKLMITPVPKTEGEVVRYKKNGEVAKKRGPPKGYKRKPKDLSQSFTNGTVLQVCLCILT